MKSRIQRCDSSVERDQALAIALADDAQDALVEVDLRLFQVDQLRDPEARRVEQLEHGAVAVAEGLFGVRRAQERIHLVLGQRLRQRTPDAWHLDVGGRVGVALRPSRIM